MMYVTGKIVIIYVSETQHKYDKILNGTRLVRVGRKKSTKGRKIKHYNKPWAMSYTLHIITTNGAQIITNGMVESVVNEWNGENEKHFSFQQNREHQEKREEKEYIFLMKIAEMENSLIINLWNTSHFSFPFSWATLLLPSDRHHRYWWCSMWCCIFIQAPRLPKGHRLNFYTLNKRTKTLIITELVENVWKILLLCGWSASVVPQGNKHIMMLLFTKFWASWMNLKKFNSF